MKYFPVFIFVALFVLFFSLATHTETVNPIQHARECTVLIDTKEPAEGTGVIVSMSDARGHFTTYVWTAAHVVLSVQTAHMRPANLMPFTLFIDDVKLHLLNGRTADAEVIAYDVKSDIALLRVKVQDWSKDSVKFYHGAPLVPGTHVFHIGNFHGATLQDSYSEGVISHINRWFKFDQLSCAIYPGSSGGGVFTQAGECYGLADQRAEETIAMIVPYRSLEEFARLNGLQAVLP